MNEKLQISVDDIISGIQSNYEMINQKIATAENVCGVKKEINDFFDFVDRSIVAVFYNNNAGETIKKLYTIPEKVTVKSKDFSYGISQYEEYLDGMKKYIDESNLELSDSPEIKQAVQNIGLKDLDFIRSLFDESYEKSNDVAKECYIRNALVCANELLKLRDMISMFKTEPCANNEFDKLTFLSKVRFIYFTSTGILNQLKSIVTQVNGDEEKETNDESTIYAVF